MLRFWAFLNPKVTFLSEDFGVKKRPSIYFLAHIRNKYLDAIDGKYKDFDIVMIVDMDMFRGWDKRGIYDTFAKIDQWQAVCANGIFSKEGHMYDAFSFRNDEFPNGPHSPYWSERVPKMQKIYPVNTDFVPVRSCFNGLAFYKRAFIEGCRYASDRGDCEHIPFHDCIHQKNNGNMFMNPSMIIRYPWA